MADYLNDNEQLSALKLWWDNNGKKILLLTAVVIVALLAYQAVRSHSAGNAQQAAALYNLLLTDLKSHQPIRAKVEILKKEYADSTYAQFAAMQMAAMAVNRGNFERAEQELQWAVDHNNDEYTHTLAELRLARVKFSRGSFDDAATIVARQKGDLYQMQFKELLGDILVKQNKPNEAKTAYLAAKEAADKIKLSAPMLELKLNNLAL